MRKKLNSLERYTDNENQLVNLLGNFYNSLDFHLIDDWYDKEIIESIFEDLGCECWHMFLYKEPRENIFLSKLHKKLKKHIENENNRYK